MQQTTNQLSLFDLIDTKSNIIQKIKQEFKENEIDLLYEKEIANKCCLFTEIKKKLSNCKGYKKYITKLFKELSNYFEVVEDAFVEHFSREKEDDILISFSNDCIILATYRCVGPIFSIKMLENRLREVNYEI